MASDWNSHVFPHGELTELAPGLWVVTGSLPKSPLPRNMVVYRLPSGGLWIHSAVALDEAGMAALEALGDPEILVVPNRFHRADAAVWKQRFPNVVVCCPSGARQAVEQVLPVDKTDEEALAGLVSIHQPTGDASFEHAYELPLEGGFALVVTDTVFNIREHFPGVAGFLARYVSGSTGHFGVTRLGSVFLWGKKDKVRSWFREQAAREGLKVFCMSHGEPVTEGIPAQLEQAAARL